MSEEDKTIRYPDSWAVYKACKAYNKDEITIDQLDLVFRAVTECPMLPDVKRRIVEAKNLMMSPYFKDNPENNKQNEQANDKKQD